MGANLKTLLQTQSLVMPGAYNAFGAKQIAGAGFDGIYISGAGISNSLGVPDNGSLSLDDFLYIGRWIVQAVDIPVICDADTGFDTIDETVERYIEAGFSGMHIEDQVYPKICGHLPGKEVIARDEMTEKVRQACKTRDQLDSQFMIAARTDARGASNIDSAVQLDESIIRGKSYQDAGADIIFPESLTSLYEFERYRKEVSGYLLANMTEFGKTPFIKAKEFINMGYNIVIFPVSLFRFHAGQTETFLSRLKEDGGQEGIVAEMMDRAKINAFLNYEP